MARRKPHTKLDKCGWRIDEFYDSAGLGRALIYEMIGDGRIRSAKIAGARIILESPQRFLQRHEQRHEL
jgi:hypothetical protein